MNTQPLGPNQEKWLAALESGEYVQGDGWLRTSDDEFCCLGIGCTLAGLAMREGVGNYYAFEEIYTALAPPGLIQWLALRGDLGPDKSGGESLARLNDSRNTFVEIAQLVRADPAAYFSEAR